MARAGAFGSDEDVTRSYGTQRTARESYERTLSARANDPTLPRSLRESAQRGLLQQQSAEMNDAIQERGLGLNRMEARAGLRRGDTDFGLTRARALGSASDYRGAVGADIDELSHENADIDARLSDPSLTVDQRAGLQSRKNANRKSIFNEQQDAIDTGYKKEDLEGYDIERLGLTTRRNIVHKLPFGVGNTLALDMQQVGQNQTRLRQLEGRMAEESRGGNLSPQRRFDFLREESSLMEENAGIAGELSHGLENYLPNMSSGAPTGFQRYNSLSLAARFGRDAGSLNGSYGFAGGQHAAGQQAAIQQLTGGVLGHTPVGGGNLPGLQGGGSDGLLSQIAGILQRIEAKGGFGGNGTKGGEARGATNGALMGEGNPTIVPGYRGR